jgi:hypothetical protein
MEFSSISFPLFKYLYVNLYDFRHRNTIHSSSLTYLCIRSERFHPLPVEAKPLSDGPHHVRVIGVGILRHEKSEAMHNLWIVSTLLLDFS